MEPAGPPPLKARYAWKCFCGQLSRNSVLGSPASRWGAEGRAVARPRCWDMGGQEPGRAATGAGPLALLPPLPPAEGQCPGTSRGLRYPLTQEKADVWRGTQARLPVLGTSLPGKAELKQETISFSCQRGVFKQKPSSQTNA